MNRGSGSRRAQFVELDEDQRETDDGDDADARQAAELQPLPPSQRLSGLREVRVEKDAGAGGRNFSAARDFAL